MASLPDAKSPTVHLVQATPEENSHLMDLNSHEWRGALTLEQYRRRESHLADQPLTRDGGLVPWMLVADPVDGQSSRLILCACETIRKRALVSRGDGKVEDVVAIGVASVFCAQERRGKGYAGRMIELLGEALGKWDGNRKDGKDGNVRFSILFSDIGKRFYADRGWKAFESAHVVLPAGKGEVDEKVKFLVEESEIRALCERDEKLIRQRMAKVDASGGVKAAIIPDYDTISWHHAREVVVAEMLHMKVPSIMGAMVELTDSRRVWCLWHRVWNANPADNVLHIVRLVVDDAEFEDFGPASSNSATVADVSQAVALLLRTAQAQAAEWGLDHVELWNPSSTTAHAAKSIDPENQVVQREKDSITSLRWYGDDPDEAVQWICNEKFGWC